MTYQSVINEVTRYPLPTQRYEPVAPLDLLGLLSTLWRGKLLLLFTTICALAFGGYYAFHMTNPRYQATATLQIEATPTALRGVAEQWDGPGTDPSSLNTEVTVLTSNRILGQVIDQLNLLEDPEFNRYLQEQSPYSVTAIRGRLRHLLAGTTPTAPDETAIYEKTIQNLRAALTVARPQDTYIFEINARSGTDEKAMTLANVTVAAYVADQQRLKDTASLAAESWLSARVRTLEQQLGAQETAVNDLIATAQIQENTKLDAISNQILLAEQRVDEAQGALAALQSAATQSPRQSAAISQLQTEIAEVSGQSERLRAQLSAQSAGLVRLQQMQREAEATRVLYETFLARLQETRVQRGLADNNSQLIFPATSAQYLGPHKILIIEIAGLLGVLLGLTLITLRETLRNGAGTAAQLHAAMGVPVFAQSSQTSTRSTRHLQRSMGRFAPAMRAMRTELMLAADGHTPAVILVTASRSGEDKTAHAIALAHSLTQAGKDVLLLGADLTKPDLTQCLGARPAAGIADVIAGGVSLPDALVGNLPLGFDLLMARSAHTSNDPILTDRVDSICSALRERYDHIVIDAPPVLTDPTTALWALLADAVLYGVQWSKTPLATVQAGLDKLHDAGCPVTGLFLTKVSRRMLRQDQQAPRSLWRRAVFS
ncbi:GumC family protein [Loktanella sp. Alg231-35]|uniref:GumC family protein n=1 Tax=Loktanella sp. Alg231-35 TaxID=1922220 RepID=UPI00131F0A11|nr:polysaccharide biosynthesis tyrosine autokinase [Loktanella sp. Alg231-35]